MHTDTTHAPPTTTTMAARPCAVCGQPILAGEPVVTEPAIFAGDDPLWRFSCSGIHTACFHRWADTPVAAILQLGTHDLA